MTDRQGIEIDFCPKCRGVWLDRGELDKIIEKSATVSEPSPDAGPIRRPNEPDFYQQQQQYKYHKKRKSFLEEIFD
jgi:Zn-finger nucleic acid-binding protein